MALKPLGQERSWTCGPASLRWVLRSFGMRIPEARLAKLCRTTRSKGTSWAGLLEGVERLGLRARRGEGEVEPWDLPGGRTLVGWDDAGPGEAQDDHLSVLVRADQHRVFLMDPHPLRKGRIRELSYGDFMRRWHDRDFKENRDITCGYVVVEPP